MSEKLKSIVAPSYFEARYDSDTAYRAFGDPSGALHIVEFPSRASVTVAADAAADLIDDLRDAGDAQGYGDNEINAVQHWLLARAFDRLNSPRRIVLAHHRSAA